METHTSDPARDRDHETEVAENRAPKGVGPTDAVMVLEVSA